MCEVVAASILDQDSGSIFVSIAITFAPKAATEHTRSVVGTWFLFLAILPLTPGLA